MLTYPIVFIPGLFGSLGDDVIKGTGKFSFGPAEGIYKPFIKILNSMGYIEGENLFISYYDWKKPVLEAVNKYLYEDIERVKKETGHNKVILIGHSLGGLLARAYMAYFSPSSIDKLIMIATPNFGSANAYYFWSGGKLPYEKIEDNILYNGIKLAFELYFDFYEDSSYIHRLREMFPVVEDLLPSYDYGNYLYTEEDGIQRDIDIRKMSIENTFLNRLNNRALNEENVYIISGSGVKTNFAFEVELANRKNKWIDGKPLKSQTTIYGDGTVTSFSSLGNKINNSFILESNHTNILYDSRYYIANILGKELTNNREENIEIVSSDNYIFE